MNTAKRDQSIILMGFMGVGKSTIGPLLATDLKLDFVDMDKYIEKREGRSISTIFETEGEKYFRKVESDVLAEILDGSPKVIATGGGTPCSSNNSKLIIAKSKSIWLMAGVDRILERVGNGVNRPIIAGNTPSSIRKAIVEKLRERKKYYSRADIKVRSIGEATDIVRRIKKKLDK